jgi:hypothetical protein
MEVKEASTEQITSVEDLQPGPAPRERLHQNIERLQTLSEQLFGHQLEQADLLIAIELVGFKVQHLARQIQEAENLGADPGDESKAKGAAA